MFKMSPEDLKMLDQINRYLGWNFPESEMLSITYKNIKTKGGAFKVDIAQLAGLGIPLFEMLSITRDQSIRQLINDLHKGSINYYEIRHMLNAFASNIS